MGNKNFAYLHFLRIFVHFSRKVRLHLLPTANKFNGRRRG